MRHLDLFIRNRKVELDEDSLILLNFTFEEIGQPAVVKNSYTKRIVVKGTPANDEIFGNLWRLDYRTTSENFNALSREPFSILNNAGEMVTSGYVKVDGIKDDGLHHSYEISLYGGMGGIFYMLSYGKDGRKKTLADLTYIRRGIQELDFTLNKENVQKAWNRIKTYPEYPSEVFDVINFAPCYNGIPDKGFDAQKGMIAPEDMGIPAELFADHKPIDGKGMVTFSQKVSEFEVGDLRSYLQRPVLSVYAFMRAIKGECQKNGYTFDFSDLEMGYDRGSFNDSFNESFDKGRNANYFPFPYMRGLWLTLPMMSKINFEGNESIPVRYSWDDILKEVNPIALGTLQGAIPVDANVSGDVDGDIWIRFKEDPVTTSLGMSWGEGADMKYAIAFLQLIAKRGEEIVGNSSIVGVGSLPEGKNLEEIAHSLGYVPVVPAKYKYDQSGIFNADEGRNVYRNRYHTRFDLDSTTGRADTLEVHCFGYHYTKDKDTGQIVSDTGFIGIPLYQNRGQRLKSSFAGYVFPLDNMSYVSTSAVSFAKITKKRLLTTKNTPAEYLLSFAKTFGLTFLYDPVTKTLKLMRRSRFFTGEVVDFSERVNLIQKEYEPYCIKSKYYNFKTKETNGQLEKAHESEFGREYGSQRVDTDFEFDSKDVDVMQNVLFKNGVTCLEQSPNFALYYNGDSLESPKPYYPSPLSAGGGKFTLWKGKTPNEIPLFIPSCKVKWFNEELRGYDCPQAFKLQLHDKTDKGLDGSDILLMYSGEQLQEFAHLSDDTSAMYQANNGVPCYDLTINPAGLQIPIFVRSYRWNSILNCSLDFGVPAELYAPNETYPEDNTLYSRFWKDYISDRYSADTKVVRVKVNLNGLQVGQEMMRKFYFFGGQLWQLNKIMDYSLTTDDLTECEFVKVNNPANYAEES